MKNLFLFTGSETFLLHEKIKIWKKAFISKHGNINLEQLDATQTPVNEIMAAVNSMPFLGERRLIFNNGLPEPPKKGKGNVKTSNKTDERDDQLKKLVGDLDDIPETSIVIFVQSNPDKRKSFYKQLIKKAELKEFKPLAGYVLTQWIQQQVQQKGASISPHEADYLASITAHDLWRLSTEIEKLSTYSHQRPITRVMIEALVTPSLEANIFHLTDALGVRDFKKAIACLHRSVAAGEKLQPIFYMIIRQFRLLLQGVSFLRGPNPSPSIFTSKLKLHPFVAKNTLAQARHFQWDELKRSYAFLLQIDTELKTGGIKVYADDQTELIAAVERFILSFKS